MFVLSIFAQAPSAMMQEDQMLSRGTLTQKQGRTKVETGENGKFYNCFI